MTSRGHRITFWDAVHFKRVLEGPVSWDVECTQEVSPPRPPRASSPSPCSGEASVPACSAQQGHTGPPQGHPAFPLCFSARLSCSREALGLCNHPLEVIFFLTPPPHSLLRNSRKLWELK